MFSSRGDDSTYLNDGEARVFFLLIAFRPEFGATNERFVFLLPNIVLNDLELLLLTCYFADIILWLTEVSRSSFSLLTVESLSDVPK